MIQRKPDNTAVVIVAAGSGNRMGGELPKQYRFLAGKPVLRWSVEAFLRAGILPERIQVVAGPAQEALCLKALEGLSLPRPVSGGETRQRSVYYGLQALALQKPEYVLIHDAVRPFVHTRTIHQVMAALGNGAEAVLPVIPVVDTLKSASADGIVTSTVDRAALVRAQTPQGFRYLSIVKAHEAYAAEALTDDAALAERAGLAVQTVMGSEANMKLTTPYDWQLAEQRLAHQTRTGLGTDVHGFGEAVPDATICLGGVPIAHEKPLIGHSDADVVLHALVDAVLGIIAEGDIGTHFPPSDPQWRGADSRQFVMHALHLLSARGGTIRHVDITVLAEAPKLAPHRDAIRHNVAGMLDIPVNAVGLKATTTEGLGFIGRKEGIAAQVLVTATLPGEAL